MVQILTKLGYETTEAENGVAALAMLEDGRQFDLMFTDIVMPGGMSGIKLCQEAHARFPGLRLILTSGYNNEAIADGRQLEFKAPFVRKPYRKSELGRVVREVLSNPA